VLKEVHGRSTDFVVAQDGTVMHGLALIYVLREMPEVAAFRIEQERLDLTRVAIVPGPGFSPTHQETIAAGFKKRLGMGVSVQVDLVDAIKPERSGKFRYVVSRVNPATREVLNA
jgi:phenylacetate-CoA ligase